MSIKQRIITILITVFTIFFVSTSLFKQNIIAKEEAGIYYNVYLDGEKIGVINSKDILEKYINGVEKELKSKFNVDSIYMPQGLYIEKYIGYSKKISTEEEMYKKIIEKKPFTLKGYVVTLSKDDSIIKLNVLNINDFKNAISSTIKAFISDKEYNDFLDNIIENSNNKIEDIYIEENITIREALIPIVEKIYLSEEELTRHILYGDVIENKEYTVKLGDSLEEIAFNNELGLEELLIVNPKITTKDSLLYIGQKINVTPVAPIINVVVEKDIIEEKVVEYSTKIKYDESESYGYRKIEQEGIDGKQKLFQKIKYENGYIVAAVIYDTEIIEPTIDRIEIRGTFSVNDPVIFGDNEWIWPTPKPYNISSSYGWRTYYYKGERITSFHSAVDMYTSMGRLTPIFAANSGNVSDVGWYPTSGGNQIIINHNNGFFTVYAHLSEVYVKKGQAVNAGEIIGLMGDTGMATGVHLHFGTFGCSTCNPLVMNWNNHFNPMLLYK